VLSEVRVAIHPATRPACEAEEITAAVIAMLVRAQQRDGDVPTEPQKLQQSTPIGEATRIDEMVNGHLSQIPYHPVGGAK
jgi:hypothetical protein